MDAAVYLAGAEITMQSLFGMTYLENFMGVSHVFLTNKIPAGKIIVTPADNVRAFTVDFSELARGGLVYQTEARGLIGVATRAPTTTCLPETNVLVGLQLVPEVLDFIVIATFGKAPDKEDAGESTGGESTGGESSGGKDTGDEGRRWRCRYPGARAGCEQRARHAIHGVDQGGAHRVLRCKRHRHRRVHDQGSDPRCHCRKLGDVNGR